MVWCPLFIGKAYASTGRIWIRIPDLNQIDIWKIPICTIESKKRPINFSDIIKIEPHEIKVFTLVDRKSTRLNSSHVSISYAVFCLKKKKLKHINLVRI